MLTVVSLIHALPFCAFDNVIALIFVCTFIFVFVLMLLFNKNFCITAALMRCTCECLQTLHIDWSVFAVTSVPGRPGCPVVDKVNGSRVTVHWTTPGSDGGSKITHYVVYYGTADMDLASFEKHRITACKTSCTVGKHIRWNRWYRFGVAAENKEGIGLLSEFSEWIKTPCSSGMYF